MSPLLVLRFQFFTGGHWFTVRASTVDNLMVTESLLRQEKDLFTSVSDFFFFFFKVLLQGDKQSQDFNFLEGSVGPRSGTPGNDQVGPASGGLGSVLAL